MRKSKLSESQIVVVLNDAESGVPIATVGQADATASRLRLQSPVLFTQEVDDIALLSLEPSEQRRLRYVTTQMGTSLTGDARNVALRERSTPPCRSRPDDPRGWWRDPRV